MPSPIGTVGQLVGTIQRKLSGRTEFTSQKPSSTKSKSFGKSDANPQGNLEALIGQRIKAIDYNDTNRGRKAFRVFLESILLSHFGDQLMNDPQFYQLVDDIQISMESDTEIRSLIDDAIQHLISSDP
jgi:hypothetical protein